MIAEAAMAELRAISSGAREMVEADITYVHLPQLRIPCVSEPVEGLLCIQKHGGYTTRLFLSRQIAGKGANWSSHQIFGRTWYTWSWNNVPSSLRPAEILRCHLEALK